MVSPSALHRSSTRLAMQARCTAHMFMHDRCCICAAACLSHGRTPDHGTRCPALARVSSLVASPFSVLSRGTLLSSHSPPPPPSPLPSSFRSSAPLARMHMSISSQSVRLDCAPPPSPLVTAPASPHPLPRSRPASHSPFLHRRVLRSSRLAPPFFVSLSLFCCCCSFPLAHKVQWQSGQNNNNKRKRYNDGA